jgi:hypothetical protein
MPSTGSREQGRSVLPSFATPAIVAGAAWVAIGPYVWSTVASSGEQALIGPLPGGVALAFALADYGLWRRRGRPWHDWQVILLLLPAIAAAVWVAVGATVLDARLSRPELLSLSLGPGIWLIGLLTTMISYHGRHHPDEFSHVL